MCVTNSRRRPKSLSLALSQLAKSRGAGGAVRSNQKFGAGSSLFASVPRHAPSSSADTVTSNGGANGGSSSNGSANGCGVNGGQPPHPGALLIPRNGDEDGPANGGVKCAVSSNNAIVLPLAVSEQQQQSQSREGTYVQGVYIPQPKPQPKRIRKPQKPGKTAKMNDRHFVKHDYHDHAGDVADEPEPPIDVIAAAVLGNKEDQPKKKRGRVSVSFPRKLHFLLDQIEADGLAHVISWLPHGRAFSVHKPKTFVEEVMPKYFKQTKLTSFQRQLNLYGFSRLTRGRDNGGYYNEYFLRGKPFLTKNMVRTRVKGTKFKAASSPDQEPNFYKMEPVSLPEMASYHVIVSEDEKTSSSSSSSSASKVEHCEKPSFTAPAPPPQVIVTVPSFDTTILDHADKEGTWVANNAPVSPICPTKVTKRDFRTEHTLENFATIPLPPSPSLALKTPEQGSQFSRNLWDCLDPHISTPIPPNLDQPIIDAAPWQPPHATENGVATQSPEHPAIVTAPPSRSDSGAEEAFNKEALDDFFSTLRSPSSAVPTRPAQNTEEAEVDPLIDFVQEWISEDALEQAVSNDADFGRMLEMIAE